MKSKKWLWMLVLALTFVLAACGGFSDDADDSSTDSKDNEHTNTDTSGGEKVLKLSLDNDIPDLNQVLTTDGISFQVLNKVMEGLFRLDANNEPQPASAESVNISDDKLTYTFKIREGLKWSDGSD